MQRGKLLRAVTIGALLMAAACIPGQYSVSWTIPYPASATPLPVPTGTHTATPTVSIDPTPTRESGTPIPTAVHWTPAPDVFRVYRVTAPLNVRSSPGVDKPIVERLEAGELVELDSGIAIGADGYVWHQVYSHPGFDLLGWAANHRLEEFRG